MEPRPTVLVVDDTPENLTVIGGLLLPDHRVRVANSGTRALQVAGTEPRPDLILLDVMMPDMDGHAVLAQLLEDPLTRDIPVIFITALDACVLSRAAPGAAHRRAAGRRRRCRGGCP
jgi:cyclic di-GMP phosphodiesterase